MSLAAWMARASATIAERVPALSAVDVQQLTLWKWKYEAEYLGFAGAEADRLVFARLLARSGRLNEGDR